MTQTVAYLEAIVGADITSFRRGMQEVRSEVGFLSDTMGGLSRMGRLMTFGLTVPMVAFGAAAASVFSEFEAEMRNIASISDQVAGRFEFWSDKVREFGEASRSGPQAAAASMYELVSAGYEGDEAFTLMTASIHLAEANLSELDATTRAMAATLMSYHMEASEATNVSDVWTRMVQVGVGRLDDFIASASKVLPFASAIGVEFEDLGGIWAYVSQQGFGATKAGTALGMALSNLMRPNEALAAAMHQLGANSATELIDKFGGLGEALFALRNAVGDNPDLLAQMFSKTGVSAVLAVTNDLAAFNEQMDLYNRGLTGATDNAWEEQMQSFAAQIDLMKSAFQGFMIVVGGQVAEILTPFIHWLTDAFTAASHLSPEVIKLGIVIAGLVAAAGPLLWLIGSLTSPFVILGGAIAAFMLDVGGVRTALEAMIPPEIGAALDDLKNGILEFFNIFTGADLQKNADDFSAMFNFEIPEGVVTVQDFSVVPGDTPGELAARLGVTVQDILDATGAASVYTMPIGDFQLEIPGLTGGMSGVPLELQGVQQQLENMADTNSIGSSLGERFSAAVDAAWPQISDALTRLKDSFISFMSDTVFPGIRDWVTTTGATMLGDAIGSLAGEIAQLVGSAISGTDTAALRATQTAFDEIRYGVEREPSPFETFGRNFITGLKDGFVSALQDANFDNVGELIFSSAIGAIGAAFVVSRIITALTGFNVGGRLVSGLANVIKSALAANGAAQVGTEVVTSVGEATTTAATGAAGVTAAGVIAAAIAGVIAGVAIYNTFQEPIEAVTQDIFRRLGEATENPDLLAEFRRNFENAVYNAVGRTDLVIPYDNVQFEPVHDQFDFTPAAPALDVSQISALTPEEYLRNAMESGVGGGQLQLNPALYNDYFTQATGMMAEKITEMGIDPKVVAASQETGKNITANILDKMQSSVTEGEVNPTTIASTLTVPLSEAFIAAFGPEGSVGLVWNAFVTDVGADLTIMGQNFIMLQGVAVGAITNVANNAVTHFGRIRSAIYGVVSAISSMIQAIHGLQSAMGSLNQTNMSLPSAGPSVPGHATGGLMNPGDTAWVGETGAELFTASRRGFVMPNSSLRGSVHGSGGGSVNYITIQEANNVDQMLFELKRRGITFQNG